MYILNKYIYDKINNYEIYYKSKLPNNGWIQSCINCDTFTSYKIELYNKDSMIFYVYICPIVRNDFLQNTTF